MTSSNRVVDGEEGFSSEPAHLYIPKSDDNYILQQQAYIAYQQLKMAERAKEKLAKAQRKASKKQHKHQQKHCPSSPSGSQSVPTLSSMWATYQSQSLQYGYDPRTGLAADPQLMAQSVGTIESSPPPGPHGFATAGFAGGPEAVKLEYEAAKIKHKTDRKMLKVHKKASKKVAEHMKKQRQYCSGVYPIPSRYAIPLQGFPGSNYSPSLFGQRAAYYKPPQDD